MRKLFRDNRVIIVIILVGLLLRLSAFIILKPWNEKVVTEKIVRSDGFGYQAIALNLLTAGQFKTSDINSKADPDNSFYERSYDTLRTPGYPYFLFIIYGLFGVKVYMVLLVQIILNIISLIVVFKLAKSIFNNSQVAHIAALLFAIEPHQIYHALLLYTDTLFVTLFLLFSFLLYKGIQVKKIHYFILSSIILGCCILVRPIAKFLPFLAIIFLLLSPIGKYSYRIKLASAYLILCASIVSLWLYRNYKEYNHIGLCTDQGITLLVRNAANMESARVHVPNAIVEADLEKQTEQYGFSSISNPFDKEAICSKVAIKTIKQHIPYYIKTHVEGMFSMFVALGHRGIANYFGIVPNQTILSKYTLTLSSKRFLADNITTIFIGLYIVFLLCVNYPFFIVGSFFMFKNKMSKIWAVLFCLIVYFSCLTGVLGLAGGERFKLPVMPFICIVGGYGCYCLLKIRITKMRINGKEVVSVMAGLDRNRNIVINEKPV